ncbi:hypothetical protein [Aurantimonas sp. Leaf443]|uniref:hypothetical protein n=1 Tax=Aurantimonas sp. Leaf443 TaxID=1736378 RepID=UPI0006F2BAEF|nr:hypothetical protein [Aurantimonas sp. Leaf443]KQT82252.1 hypothetical protein ASG48_16620 [Aurantimonas sp. Leaf443]
MAARFTKLNNAMKSGLETMAVKAAVEQIEYWEEQLAEVEVSGAKGILSDLGSLKTKLQAEEVDGAAVKKLLGSLGEKTAKIAGRVDDEAVSQHLTQVAQGLEKAG